jgi:hypothetical protein
MDFDYLVIVAGFGAGVVIFLWARDARIFWRTGLSGYRKAAYHGILFTATGLLGLSLVTSGQDFIGLGLVLLALYLQGKETREKVWTRESAVQRFFGTVRRRNDKGSA